MEFTDFPGLESFFGDFRLPDIENRAKTRQNHRKYPQNARNMPSVSALILQKYGGSLSRVFLEFFRLSREFLQKSLFLVRELDRKNPRKPLKTARFLHEIARF